MSGESSPLSSAGYEGEEGEEEMDADDNDARDISMGALVHDGRDPT